jgi:two-component system, OmpR family, response regulator QseB
MLNRLRPRLLIVEDHEILAQCVSRLFEDFGIDSVTATTVAGANRQLDIPIDAVLLDVLLPDGTACDVIRAARAAGVKAQILIWTALGRADLDDVIDLTPDEILYKPTSIAEIEALADRIKVSFRRRGK